MTAGEKRETCVKGSKTKPAARQHRAGDKEPAPKRRVKQKSKGEEPKSGRTGPYDDPHRRPA